MEKCTLVLTPEVLETESFAGGASRALGYLNSTQHHPHSFSLYQCTHIRTCYRIMAGVPCRGGFEIRLSRDHSFLSSCPPPVSTQSTRPDPFGIAPKPDGRIADADNPLQRESPLHPTARLNWRARNPTLTATPAARAFPVP